jgi:hypothetical protein
MVSAVELRRIAAFSDLPDGQIDWFLSHAEEMILQVNTVTRTGTFRTVS